MARVFLTKWKKSVQEFWEFPIALFVAICADMAKDDRNVKNTKQQRAALGEMLRRGS